MPRRRPGRRSPPAAGAPSCAATSTAPNSPRPPRSPPPKSAPPNTSPHNSTNSTPNCASCRPPAATNRNGPSRSLPAPSPTCPRPPRQPSPAPPRCRSPSPSSTPHPHDERTAALHALHDAATAANRNLLWCSPTQEQAARPLADDLAPAAATVTETHAQITSGHTALPPGTLIVVDDAATADPAVLADLAEHAAAAQSGLILLDTTGPTWPPQPSRQLLRPAAHRATVDRHTERPPQLRRHHPRHPARPRSRTRPEPPTAPEPARRPPQRQPHPRRPTPRRHPRRLQTPPRRHLATPTRARHRSNRPRTSASATTTSRMRGTRGSVTFVFGGFSVFVPGLGTFCR